MKCKDCIFVNNKMYLTSFTVVLLFVANIAKNSKYGTGLGNTFINR